MDDARVSAFFERLETPRPAEPSADALARIQLQMLLHAPFENLDVIEGKVPLSLDEDALFEKIVERKRGGICYELNTLLAAVLEQLGYEVAHLAARHPKYGDDFDHMLLSVRACDSSASWLVDVGYADNVRIPLVLEETGWQSDGRDECRIVPAGGDAGRFDLVRRRAGAESLLYTFTTIPHEVAEYQPRCDWYATSSESRFTKGPLVCIEHEGGRVSLTMNRLLNTYEGKRIREDIASREEFDECLERVFGIVL